MDFGDNSTTIIVAIITAIFGLGFVFKFLIKKKTTQNSGIVNIKGSKIGGDVAGRDIKK
jgi:hypothetical protein